MLKQMRDGTKSKAVKLVLFGLLLLATLGFALIGGQGSFREALKNNTIVSFGRDKVSAPEFDHMVRNAMRGSQMKESDAYKSGLPYQVLQREIDRRLFSRAVYDAGILIDDVQAAKQIKEQISPLVEKGMSQKDALQYLLNAYGISEDGLVSSVKTQIAVEQLFKILGTGITPPDQMVTDLLKLRSEQRRGEYFRLTAANAGAVPKPSDDELRTYYGTLAHEYAVPEYRTLSVLVLDKSIMTDGAEKISDDKALDYYNNNISDYGTPETRTIAQAVAADETAANDIYNAAKAGQPLRAAAKGKGNFVTAQPYTQNKIAIELSKTAFSGAAGDVLPPVQSPLGWHVMQIEKVTPGTTKPFSAVKADIIQELSQDKASEALYEFSNKIDDELAGGKTVSEVAKEHHLTETTLEKINARGLTSTGQKAGGSLPVYDKLVETGFKLTKGAASQLIETPEGSFAIVGVKDVFPSETKPFDSVRADILSRWMTERSLKALGEKAAAINDRLKKGETLTTLAAEFGQSVQSTGFISRATDPVKARIDTALRSALFSIDSPGQTISFPADNAVTILRLAERKTDMPAKDSKDVTDMRAVLARSLSGDILASYRMGLVSKYDVEVNTKLMNTIYTRKAEDAAADE